ncbi:hypothetical protein KPY62_10420 [Psychrobacter sp. TAE2020]|uniref:hypothetical protein n=1 Tax=Psychrobacter sp. TAE2020 TaxID=2846762 RepID=UPI001C10EC58|nr:hypothetical protein [Psychrobacter sp. TAE2020]MBU5617494.1 hypothetical protein [Psychrobacter sp. TAE2020]
MQPLANYLINYTPWQAEMAVVASLLQLGLLSDKQIFDYTHYLLDNEHYDDEMLAIIDDDPIYSQDKKDLFQKTVINLGFPRITTEQAKWIYTCSIIYKHTVQPENYSILENGQAGLHYIFEEFFEYDDNLEDVKSFANVLYCIDEAAGDVHMGYVQTGYNDAKTLLALKSQFFEICQRWIDRNHKKIASIFANLYA